MSNDKVGSLYLRNHIVSKSNFFIVKIEFHLQILEISQARSPPI